MAEIAAGAYVAAEVVEHGAQAAYAGYLVSKPTLPLKATFSRIATAADDLSRRSLARSNHSATVIGNKAYIFGGETAANILASNDVHAVTLEHSDQPEMDYSMIPALPSIEGELTPTGRTNHSACAFHENVAIYGGCNDKGDLIDEKSSLWLFSPERKSWDILRPSGKGPSPGPRKKANLFASNEKVVLFGGIDSSGSAASDLWQFDVGSRTWSQLPTAPVATNNATLANGQLWLISSSDAFKSQIHHLSISHDDAEETDKWQSFDFPINPLVAGPRARHDGALLPITTGWGRNYLVYLLGARDDFASTNSAGASAESKSEKEATQWSDTWVLQIPASDLETKAAWSLKEAIKPAKIKDAIRSAIGAETGHLKWAEAVVQVPSELPAEGEEGDGKLHPGPRAFFGADVLEKGNKVVFWGGVDPNGQRVGDGWIVEFE